MSHAFSFCDVPATANKSYAPITLPEGEMNASMSLTLVRLDQYPKFEKGHTMDEVKAYIARLPPRDQGGHAPGPTSSSHSSVPESNLACDTSDSEVSAFEDVSIAEFVNIFNELNIGFVAVTPTFMDQLIEESRVVGALERSTIGARKSKRKRKRVESVDEDCRTVSSEQWWSGETRAYASCGSSMMERCDSMDDSMSCGVEVF
jgi:hypothetical protein